MHLILSSADPRDSDYSTEAGKILYKARKSGYNITSLEKVQNSGYFTFCAQVKEGYGSGSTRFCFNNKDLSVDVYFRKEGRSKPKEVFLAADGRKYYWKSGGRRLEMFRKGVFKRRVVRFRERKRSFGAFITGRPTSLEVDNSCLPILDEIIMTFVYTFRREQGQNRQQIAADINYHAAPSHRAILRDVGAISTLGTGISAFGVRGTRPSGGGDTGGFDGGNTGGFGGGDSGGSGGGGGDGGGGGGGGDGGGGGGGGGD